MHVGTYSPTGHPSLSVGDLQILVNIKDIGSVLKV